MKQPRSRAWEGREKEREEGRKVERAYHYNADHYKAGTGGNVHRSKDCQKQDGFE